MVGETESIYGMPDSGLSGGFTIKYDQWGHEERTQKVDAWHPCAAAFDSFDNLHLAGEITSYVPSPNDDAYLA